jgi:hypothetical protein
VYLATTVTVSADLQPAPNKINLEISGTAKVTINYDPNKNGPGSAEKVG